MFFIMIVVNINSIILYDLIRPFAELHCTFGVYHVTYGNDSGKTVVFGVVAFSVSVSYSKISS